jgi:putative SOS response-associated peptidase YedK
MCNLYSVRTSRAALARKFMLSDNRMAAFDALPAIFPGHMAPIIKQSADGERELVLRSWGFVLLRDGYAPKRVTNTTTTRSTASSGRRVERRCLVPATAFCEPDEGKPARWHWFALKGNKERPLFAFAGIYRQWNGPIKKDGANVDLEVFSFMTTLPNTLTATINHERSPVLLTEEVQFATWLAGTPEEAFSLVKTSDPERMQIVQSGFEKKDLQQAA